jgi:hypothetical protein
MYVIPLTFLNYYIHEFVNYKSFIYLFAKYSLSKKKLNY